MNRHFKWTAGRLGGNFHSPFSKRISYGRLYLTVDFNYDFFMGIEYAFDLSRPKGQRVCRLEREGRPIGPEEEFSLVMNNYRATGSGDFECYVGCPVIREIQTEVSELIIRYLAEHPMIQIPDPMRICGD